MAKLVVLSEGLTGRTYELKVDKTTVGRLEDNAFQISEGSVSSHHCEVVLRGTDIVVKDLNSTNGTFINGQPVKGEGVIKPGQILRLGQVEMRVEDPNAKPTPKKLEQTMVIPQGVKFGEHDGTRPVAFEKNSPFSKKKDSTKTFIIVAAVVALLIIVFIVFSIMNTGAIKTP